MSKKVSKPEFPMTLTFATEAEMIAFIQSKVSVTVAWSDIGEVEARVWVSSSTGGVVIDRDTLAI